MSDDDRYSEDEVALILRRAAEIQPGRTMSLAEIEAVADEAGIDKALVRKAALELERGQATPATTGKAALLGPTRLVFERKVAGSIDASVWGEIVAEIRRHIDKPGQIDEVGKELIWTSKVRSNGSSGTRDIRVIVTPRRDKTLVRVEEKTSSLAGGLYGGFVTGAGVGGLGWILPICIAGLGMPILIPFVFVTWLYATYRLAKAIYFSALANRRTQLRGLADGVAELVGELAAGQPSDGNSRAS